MVAPKRPPVAHIAATPTDPRIHSPPSNTSSRPLLRLGIAGNPLSEVPLRPPSPPPPGSTKTRLSFGLPVPMSPGAVGPSLVLSVASTPASDDERRDSASLRTWFLCWCICATYDETTNGTRVGARGGEGPRACKRRKINSNSHKLRTNLPKQ